jgi:NAD(P)-dependent dehydrogenase (short-subunit alcohol dehydrogenase family)
LLAYTAGPEARGGRPLTAPNVSDRTIPELLDLSGQRILVTGGAHGIGAAVAHRLAEAGAAVAVGDLDRDAANAVADDLPVAVGVGFDVTDPAAVAAAVAEVGEALGGIEGLVNNAGIFPFTPVLDSPDGAWEHVLRTNLDGAFYCSRECGRVMAAAGVGAIVNIGSTEAFRAGAPGLAAYVASKHGLEGLTKALALEWGPAGIRVLGVAPTMCETPGLDEKRPIFEAAGLADVIERTAASLPLGRIAVPDDVARVVLFCLSDFAALMTGSTLLVDAGAMAL